MNKLRFPRLSFLEWLTVASALMVGCGWAIYDYYHSWFYTDDLKNFALALNSDLWSYVATPIDVHFVPLHRLVNYILLRTAPMNFPAALVFLLVFHLGAVYYFYRLLQALCPGRLNLLVTFLYIVNSNFYAVLIWWSAGLHRLPYLFFTAACMYYFLDFLKSGCRKTLALSTVLFLLALGFYSKAVLIPVYLLSLCCVYYLFSSRQRVAQGFAAALILLVFASLYTVWFLFLQGTDTNKLSTNYMAIWEAWLVGMRIASQLLVPVTAAVLKPAIVIALWVAAIAYTSWRRPKVLGLWMLGLGCTALNVLAITVSIRVDFSPAVVGISPRYNFEMVFIQLFFLAAIAHCFRSPGRKPESATVPVWRGAALGLLLIVYATLSADKAVQLVSLNADRYLKSSVYARNLHEELSSHEPIATLNLHDEPIPAFMTSGLLPNPLPLSTFLALHQRGTPEYDQGDKALFRVTEQGKLEPVPTD